MQQSINKHKKEKKTDKLDKPKPEKNKIERLVLFTLGKSKSLLSPRQIEKEVEEQNNNQRPNYVYEVVKKLAPDSYEFPYILLFKYDDFVDKKGNIREYSNENKKNIENKICSRIYVYYSLSFGWKNKSDLKYKQEEIKKENEKFIEITIDNNNNSKSLKIELKISKPSDNNIIIKLFYNAIEIPIIIKRQKGTIYVYSTIFDTDYDLISYLDTLSIKGSGKNESISWSYLKNKKYKKKYYVLNLRGFLHYLLLTKKKNKSFYKEINQVIENLAQYDNNCSLQNKILSINNKINSIENQKLFECNFYQYTIKESFSFLNHYKQCKRYLPKNFAVNTLIEAAVELQDKLTKMNISKLKYEITSRFFNEIEKYFWESATVFSEAKLTDRNSITDEMFLILKRFQEENRYYLRDWKEKELKDHCQLTEYYKEQNCKNELKRKILKFLENTDEYFISVDNIIKSNNIKTDLENFWNIKMNVLKEICEYYRQDYVIDSGDYLIKRTKVEEAKEILKSKMTLEEAKETICKEETCDESFIIELIRLAGYGIIKDTKTNQFIIIFKKESNNR